MMTDLLYDLLELLDCIWQRRLQIKYVIPGARLDALQTLKQKLYTGSVVHTTKQTHLLRDVLA